MAFDESAAFGGDFPFRRAILNRELKRGLVNDCLVDVVGYTGPNGEAVRRAMIDAVCDALGGLGDDGNCDMARGASPGSLALVAESLGGKMVFDALQVVDAMVQARDRSQSAGGPVTAVAFSDPNDLLSYRLVPAHLEDRSGHIRIVDVIVSNATTYLGYVERPDLAHCGYAWNPHVLSMLAEGHEAGRPPRPFPASLGATCHGEIGLGHR